MLEKREIFPRIPGSSFPGFPGSRSREEPLVETRDIHPHFPVNRFEMNDSLDLGNFYSTQKCKIKLFLIFISLQVLNFDSPRGGISLEIEKTRTGTTSKLLVTRATTADTGAYTCDPSRGQPATADVHVITGKNFIFINWPQL